RQYSPKVRMMAATRSATIRIRTSALTDALLTALGRLSAGPQHGQDARRASGELEMRSFSETRRGGVLVGACRASHVRASAPRAGTVGARDGARTRTRDIEGL